MKQISFDQIGNVSYLLNRPTDEVIYTSPKEMARIMRGCDTKGTIHIYFADYVQKKPRRLIHECTDYFTQLYLAIDGQKVFCTLTGNSSDQRRQYHNNMIEMFMADESLRSEVPTAVVVRSSNSNISYYFHDTYAYVNCDIGSNWDTSIVNRLKASGMAYSLRKEATPGMGFEIMFVNDNKILIYRAMQEDVTARRMREEEAQKKKKRVFTRGIEEIVFDEHDDLDRIHFIGDLHLDHGHIIKYCNRPFTSVREMNSTILRNWNDTVQEKDLVFFLGDMSHGKDSKQADYWLQKLNGHIMFIRGNHDTQKGISYFERIIVRYKRHKFLLVHDPKIARGNWDDWVIHGHVHNHFSRSYPLLNLDNKTVNVSAEFLNYRPISLSNILELVGDS